MPTQVTGPYTALVNGKSTGFAGCSDTKVCPNAAHCLRADPQLKHRSQMLFDGRCGSFILVPKEPA